MLLCIPWRNTGSEVGQKEFQTCILGHLKIFFCINTDPHFLLAPPFPSRVKNLHQPMFSFATKIRDVIAFCNRVSAWHSGFHPRLPVHHPGPGGAVLQLSVFLLDDAKRVIYFIMAFSRFPTSWKSAITFSRWHCASMVPLTALHKRENCSHGFTDGIKSDLFVQYTKDLPESGI